MSPPFTVEGLTRTTLPQALPLLRATWPQIELAAWQKFADDFRDAQPPQTEITVMFDSAGGLCGLFASRVEPGLCEGRILAIPLLTVVDVGNSLEPVKALLDAATARARQYGCVRLQIRLDPAQGELSRRLRRFGLSFTEPVGSLAVAAAPLDARISLPPRNR